MEHFKYGQQQHASLFQMILKGHWDVLSDDEKEQWHKVAMKMNTSVLESIKTWYTGMLPLIFCVIH